MLGVYRHSCWHYKLQQPNPTCQSVCMCTYIMGKCTYTIQNLLLRAISANEPEVVHYHAYCQHVGNVLTHAQAVSNTL